MGLAPSNDIKNIVDQIKEIQFNAIQDRHRRLVVLSGSSQWAHLTVEQFLSGSDPHPRVLYISDEGSDSPASFETIKPTKLKGYFENEQ